MAKTRLPNWDQYWSKFHDLKALQLCYLNLDETLADIENKFDCKLMSGDHYLIIEALEERIETLKSQSSNKSSDMQGDLFE